MAMFISIGEGGGPPGAGWSTSGGVFDCVVEATRKLFKDDEHCCLKAIYTPLDEQGQNFIVLDYVDVSCFNLFYSYCNRAMEEFLFQKGQRLFLKATFLEFYGTGQRF